ncbi:hypothetical protein OXX80_008177 [Metschnikowia pulcherrima]
MSQGPFLTQEIYGEIVSTTCQYTSIQCLPAATAIEAVTDSENDTLEIGFSKKTYLYIFTEGHSYFQGKYPTVKKIKNCSQDELEHVYFASLPLLLTTNEFTTIWRVHESVVWELSRKAGMVWAKNDLAFCMALATSRLDKINKSPLLWHWLRKLSIIYVFNEFEEPIYLHFINQILRSMDAHYANYAAGFTLGWLVNVARALELKFDENAVISLIRHKCRQKLGDVSLWTTFGTVLSAKKCEFSETLYRHMAKSLEEIGAVSRDHSNHVPTYGLSSHESGDLIENQIKKSPNTEPVVSRDLSALLEKEACCEIKWLLDVQCSIATPYKHMLQSMHDREIEEKLLAQKLSEIDTQPKGGSTNRFCGVLRSLVNN